MEEMYKIITAVLLCILVPAAVYAVCGWIDSRRNKGYYRHTYLNRWERHK